MNSKFDLQFFGGHAIAQRIPKNPSQGGSGYNTPGINFWAIPKNTQTNNEVVNDLANIVRTKRLPQRYTQVRAAI